MPPRRLPVPCARVCSVHSVIVRDGDLSAHNPGGRTRSEDTAGSRHQSVAQAVTELHFFTAYIPRACRSTLTPCELRIVTAWGPQSRCSFTIDQGRNLTEPESPPRLLHRTWLTVYPSQLFCQPFRRVVSVHTTDTSVGGMKTNSIRWPTTMKRTTQRSCLDDLTLYGRIIRQSSSTSYMSILDWANLRTPKQWRLSKCIISPYSWA